jgi:hypothetical protein
MKLDEIFGFGHKKGVVSKKPASSRIKKTKFDVYGFRNRFKQLVFNVESDTGFHFLATHMTPEAYFRNKQRLIFKTMPTGLETFIEDDFFIVRTERGKMESSTDAEVVEEYVEAIRLLVSRANIGIDKDTGDSTFTGHHSKTVRMVSYAGEPTDLFEKAVRKFGNKYRATATVQMYLETAFAVISLVTGSFIKVPYWKRPDEADEVQKDYEMQKHRISGAAKIQKPEDLRKFRKIYSDKPEGRGVHVIDDPTPRKKFRIKLPPKIPRYDWEDQEYDDEDNSTR